MPKTQTQAPSPAETARPARLPLLTVREIVLFPHMILPLSVGRPRSIKAVEKAMLEPGRLVAVAAQKDVRVEDPRAEDFYWTGVLAEITQHLKMPDGTLKIFLHGLRRVRLAGPVVSEDGYWESELEYPSEPAPKAGAELKALMRHAAEIFAEHAKLSHRAPPETVRAIFALESPADLADTAAASSVSKTPDRQALLELLDPRQRLDKLIELLRADIEVFNLERKIHTRVRGQIEKSQREYYLNEQMKAIQKELRQKDDFAKEIEEIKKSAEAAKMPKAALEAAMKEAGRLEKMMPYSPEATVSRTYLDWMTHLPWAKKTRDRLDVAAVQKVLDADHAGLKKVKDRVTEYLAVCKLNKSLKGPILCFVGPPGVGKTTLARSIAKALGRKFARISLGGVRDEAEIRGHRRTYIGSLPGRLIQSLRKAGTKNPLFLLDEIDKMGTDWRGDPAAALLEVLDPAQNQGFLDHYLDVEFDLSQVLFICTANTTDGIPPTLQDRLELLRFSGYTHSEKRAIALEHLWPRQVKENGLAGRPVSIEEKAVDAIIDQYTREAGVRQLERELASILRKAAKTLVMDAHAKVHVTAENLAPFLGAPKFPRESIQYNAIGVSTGLAWTEAGGTLLPIEVAAVRGKGELKLTGKLGSVMVESAQAAFSYVKSIAALFGVPTQAFKDVDYHVHVPEGAIPKDGPSAGIAIATALLSYMSGRPVKPGVAMTGEITLRGRVLVIGGLKEKVLAAHRDGIGTVIYPALNEKDLEDVPKEALAQLKMVPVRSFDEVAELALGPLPASRASARERALVPPPPWASQHRPRRAHLPRSGGLS